MDDFIKGWIPNDIIQILKILKRYIIGKIMKSIAELLIEWNTRVIDFIYEL